MKIFDKKFVHFMWDNELIGKKCFFADGIDDLRGIVEKGGEYDRRIVLSSSGNESAPFQAAHGVYAWKFAYYDPNYEVKKAFSEGKTIQVQISESYWKDISSEPDLLFVCDKGGILRIKPENEKSWIVYFNREIELNGKDGYLTACREDKWGDAQEDYGAKTKLFIGSESEVEEWYKARQKFAEVIKAWEDGKQIQVTPKGTDKWIDLHFEPTWDLRDEYRVKPEEEMKEKKDEKPECPCEDGIDSKACVGCEHSEDGKPHTFENYHCYVCDKSDKKYRPYESSAEMIADFIDRFKVNCPAYCEPLIWLKGLNTDNRYFVTCFPSEFGSSVGDGVRVGVDLCRFQDLFNYYTYLDGSPVGMED